MSNNEGFIIGLLVIVLVRVLVLSVLLNGALNCLSVIPHLCIIHNINSISLYLDAYTWVSAGV